MEIIVYDNNIEKDCETVMVVDWGNFDKKVKKRPEDYVFILSADEMNKFVELNKQLYAGLTGKTMAINEDQYVNEYPGVFVIAELAVQPDFVKRYKVGHFTHKILGPCYAVFYINRSTNELERANAVLKRIVSFKENITREDDREN